CTGHFGAKVQNPSGARGFLSFASGCFSAFDVSQWAARSPELAAIGKNGVGGAKQGLLARKRRGFRGVRWNFFAPAPKTENKTAKRREVRVTGAPREIRERGAHAERVRSPAMATARS